MIKYNTKLGSEHLNMQAREQRDIIKSQLSGMHCRGCNTDTIISFEEGQFGILRPIINACCPEFENRIRKKIWGESV